MDNINSKVSVIMSVYNAESHIHNAISSILCQSYRNIEFIIVNDGSSDNSLNIIKKFMKQDPRIVLINQNNIGLTKSLNIAIKKSKGKYIARQDADDESISTRIEKQLHLLEKNNLELVTSRSIKNNKIAPNKIILHFNKKNIFKVGNNFIHGTFFAKKNIFKRILYDEKCRYAQDFKFIVDCFKQNIRIGYIVEPLYISNNIDSSISNTKLNEQNFYVSYALRSYYGNDKYFVFINRQNKFLRNFLKLFFLIIFHLRGSQIAFTII